MARIYLDNASTTAVRSEAVEAMLPFLTEHFANPSSPHADGQAARAALDGARQRTADAIGAKPDEIVFTGGGSEADSLAIFGIMERAAGRGKGFVTSAIEHHAVLHAGDALSRRGADVTVLPVDGEGFVDPEALRSALDDRTVLVSIMHANNEIGTIQRVRELAEIAHERGALFHTDAVQAIGKIPVDVNRLGVDALSLSAHKFDGPKGVGALYVRRGVAVEPRIFGGKQEHALRAGTENVAGIVGLAVAIGLAVDEMGERSPRLAALRDRLVDSVLAGVERSALNGPRNGRLPGIASVRFGGCDGSAIVMALDVEGVAVSTGSACTSGSLEPSHVLSAIGLSPDEARATVRVSLGRTTGTGEIDVMVRLLPGIIERMRRIAGAFAVGR
jgi:cysteine desulfurase